MSLRETAASLAPAAGNVKVLTLDIERSPGVFYSWGPVVKFLTPEKMITPPRTICFAAKWLHEKKPLVVDERAGHEQMIRTAWDLLSEADVVVTYNGTRSDIPWLNEHFLDYGLGPAAPFKHVDLIKTNRSRWQLPYRRLDYLAGRVVDAHKDPTDFQLWIDCLNGDDAAWARMLKYNANDVTLTEQVYLEILPWITTGPHMGILISDGQSMRCHACGTLLTDGNRWQKPARAYIREYVLYRCPHCLGWNRSTFQTGKPQLTRAAK